MPSKVFNFNILFHSECIKIESFQNAKNVNLDVSAQRHKYHSGRWRDHGEVDGLHRQPEKEWKHISGHKFLLPFSKHIRFAFQGAHWNVEERVKRNPEHDDVQGQLFRYDDSSRSGQNAVKTSVPKVEDRRQTQRANRRVSWHLLSVMDLLKSLIITMCNVRDSESWLSRVITYL